MAPDVLSRLTAEATGTALLLATVVGSGIMGETLSPHSDAVALLGNTIATGAILVVLILMFGQISGAIIGVVIAHAMFDQSLLQISTTTRTGGAQWFAEGVATFGLVSTIFLVSKARPDAVPLAVGLYITAGYWFTASTSFANPAVTIARGLTDTFSGISPANVPGFVIAQLVAAVLATGFCAWLLRRSFPNAP